MLLSTEVFLVIIISSYVEVEVVGIFARFLKMKVAK